MDQRGYTIDPNDLTLSDPKWWSTIGPTHRPSPYATASWKYLQDYEVITETLAIDPNQISVFDNGQNFDEYLWLLVLDGGDDFENPFPGVIWDGAQYTETGFETVRTFTLARVSVYDAKASSPGAYRLIEVEKEPLTTDSDPSLDLELDGDVDGSTLSITQKADIADDTPPGTLLGTLCYQISENIVTILTWDDLNWGDSKVVKMAFKAMQRSLPSCVEQIVVEDQPNAFWTSLGFSRPLKGSNTLVYDLK